MIKSRIDWFTSEHQIMTFNSDFTKEISRVYTEHICSISLTDEHPQSCSDWFPMIPQLPADPSHSLLIDWLYEALGCGCVPLTLLHQPPVFMFTWLLPQWQHLHALRTSNPWHADRWAGERESHTETEREREREREGRETSAAWAALHSESCPFHQCVFLHFAYHFVRIWIFIMNLVL